MQIILEKKKLQKAGFLNNSHGVGNCSSKGSCSDQFLLTRQWNIPEMIFNQNPNQDISVKNRFFEVDHQLKWKCGENRASNYK